MTARVFVVGSMNDDLVVTVSRHPQPGETLAGSSLNHYCGGKGLNQAIAASRAGCTTSMVGMVGNDAAGEQLEEYLAESGVDTSLVGTSTSNPTGTAVITVAAGGPTMGENSIVVVAGANAEVHPSQFSAPPWSTGDVVVAQFETPPDTTLAAFESAREVGATTLLNPSPALEPIPELLALTDVLVVNQHEFELIFDRDLPWTGTLVVTLGAEGVMAWPVWRRSDTSEAIRVEGHPVTAVDSTGAGDCFVGYLAAGIARGEPLERVISVANRAAAVSAQSSGAADSIPLLEDLPI